MEDAMASVTESVDLEVPVSDAYNQWTQFERFPQFMAGVDAVEQIDDTHLRWTISIGGATRQFDAVITEQHPDQLIAWKSIEGSVHAAGVVTFARLSDESSRVTARIDWEPDGLAEQAGALIGSDDRQVRGDLHRFKEFIESHGGETGPWHGAVDA
jgi:uncharacterized membrane protein